MRNEGSHTDNVLDALAGIIRMPMMVSAVDKSPSFHVSVVAYLLAPHPGAWQIDVYADLLNDDKSTAPKYSATQHTLQKEIGHETERSRVRVQH